MPNDTKTLNKARHDKYDEFYTLYETIEKELDVYPIENFKGKTVICPCDNFKLSNFVRYFKDNFNRFGLKRLIAICFIEDGKGICLELERSGARLKRSVRQLEGNGDYRSAEVGALRDEADIIVTNPPFSLLKDFIPWCASKKFIVLANMTSIMYTNVYHMFMNKQLWAGHSIVYGTTFFQKPNGEMQGINSIVWLTNVQHGIAAPKRELHTMQWNLEHDERLRKSLAALNHGKIEYPRYDDMDAIEVPFMNAIPSDYDGWMGVPVSFARVMDTDEWEIGGKPSERKGRCIPYSRPHLNGKVLFARILIKRKSKN